MLRKLPPLTALLAFEAAARHGRMTLAAGELHVSPGAVSKQVKLQQDWLGAALFEGPKNAPQLSALGAALAPKLSAAFDQLQAALQAAKNDHSQSVKVASYNTFAAKWLLPRMANLHTTHPQMQVELIASSEVDSQRLQGHDVCIVAELAQAIAPAGTRRQMLFNEQLGPVLSPQLLAQTLAQALAKRPTKTPRSGASQATILHIQIQALLALPRLHTQTRPSAWDAWAQAAGLPAPTLAQSLPSYQHYYFALEAALRGQGVCVAPQHLVADDIASARLVAPLGFAPSGMAYVALMQADAKPAVKAFARWLGEQVNS